MKYLFRVVCATVLAFSVMRVEAQSQKGYASFEQKEISAVGWSVDYLGSEYDPASDTTTFKYSLTAAAGEKDLSHWVLGLPDGVIPSDSSGEATKTGLDPTTGVYGFKWDDGQDSGTTATYYIVLSGHYGEEATEYAVKGGTYFAVGKTTGPTSDQLKTAAVVTYSISGTAFVDSNGNGVWDHNEPLLGNVSVNLFDENGGFITTVMTDSKGNYIFPDLDPGSYTVGISDSTSDISDDFNETLGAYFSATTGTDVNVVLGNADSKDNSFGFMPDAYIILADLRADDPDGDGFTFAGTGKTIGFWKHQNTVALKGKGRAQVDAATLDGYIAAINNLFLTRPFELQKGQEYDDALTVLSSTSSQPVDLLKKQLLGTEFNEVAGLGLSGTVDALNLDQLQTVIIAWAESLVDHCTSYSASQLLEAKDICDYINNTGE